MNFKEFTDQYFEGDTEKSLKQLVHENIYEDYKLNRK